ncbi:uncharacterized protein LTR77_007716 [Saxophila tyrrhenica]|uniref:BTB domain-containing protein n=1 Tax=Saxophila tyrrhenica TaxID=1690608 RepID=A0AAV9P5V0_9PEZI|nr:hypothetical protein LTR77_007716 [Saxophila tyrrhenica]
MEPESKQPDAASSPAKRKRAEFEDDDIEVLVGTEQARFVVHKHIICERSTFFHSACSQRWMEEKRAIELVDDDPNTFNTYLKLVYGGGLRAIDPQKPFLEYIRLYSMADRFGDLDAANAAIDGIIQFSDQEHQVPNRGLVRLAMLSSSAHSPLQRLMIDFYVREISEVSIDNLEEDNVLPKEFLAAVVKEFVRIARAGNVANGLWKELSTCASEKPKCYYHQHNDRFPACEDATRPK